MDMIVPKEYLIKRELLREGSSVEFEIKEFGKLKYFLRIEVAYPKQYIFISKKK